MSIYSTNLNFSSHGKDTANLICNYLRENHRDASLRDILNIDLSFIDQRAESTDYFVIQDVDHVDGNSYILFYSISYYIYNLCKDMDIDNDYEASINFEAHDNFLEFDIINSERNTIDEF
ncbi:hypothetical protein ACNARK_17005 [Proteus sp. DFP240708]|uniref:hypothetical protein n=1 Tax=Proteus sp. DFP240708 TaxID=3399624 RepID=UPI003A4E40B5